MSYSDKYRIAGYFHGWKFFVKNWKRASELNFLIFKFRGTQYYTFACIQHNVNFELGILDANFGFDEECVARLLPERVWLHETRGKIERFSVKSCMGRYHVYKAQTLLWGRLPCLQSTNSIGACIPEQQVLATFFWSCFSHVHFSVHFLHHHMWDSFRKGTVNRAQVAIKNVTWSEH